MRPVRALAGASRRLLLVPDGALNLVPFAALVDERGRYLVETHTLSYLTSGRDLLRLGAEAPSGRAPLVVADPDFGPRGDPGAEPARLASGVDLSRVYFAPLRGTGQEARALERSVPGARVVVQREATERALKGAHAPSVLHLATHGFFLAEAVVGPSPPERVVSRGLDLASAAAAEAVRLENPLLRSGLGLAGANARQGGDGDDGILTALEAAGLDLWGTDLVVLSACDTGVGEVRTGDGVYGLRRALVLAGSETQMMSLWPVSDAGTRDLMVAFYRTLYAGRARSDALRAVQLAMLATPRRSHPYYWASFIQSGAWGPLSQTR
jgi:CHAT domain-containing protein